MIFTNFAIYDIHQSIRKKYSRADKIQFVVNKISISEYHFSAEVILRIAPRHISVSLLKGRHKRRQRKHVFILFFLSSYTQKKLVFEENNIERAISSNSGPRITVTFLSLSE